MDVLIRLIAIVVGLGAIAVAAVYLYGRLLGRVTIHEYERGLRFDAGRFVGLVGPGVVTYPRWSSEVQVVDTRPVAMTVDGQEVLTRDGVAVKVSLVVRTAIGDPVARQAADQDVDRLIYLLVQLGLRDVVAARDLADLIAARSTVGAAILEAVAERLGAVGVELLSVDVRDVMLPAELKRAQAAVAAARHEGAASLERARGETAALRNLANAGSLLDQHPGLLSLRLVQELAQRGGNTVVLGAPEAPLAAAPRPARRRRTDTAAGDTDPA